MHTSPKLELGTISGNIRVENSIIRLVSDHDDPILVFHMQGRIRNVCQYALDEVKCDLSYFDSNGSFLGLDMSSVVELNYIDPNEVAPFNIELNIPIEATRFVLNVHSQRILQDIGVALKEYVDQEAQTTSPENEK